jgi:hypothetical protein
MLLIRCNANYHVMIWCEMQTDIWMAFSDSTHFSEQLSYKILFISSYSLKDKNFASLDHFPAIFRKNRNGSGLASPRDC